MCKGVTEPSHQYLLKISNYCQEHVSFCQPFLTKKITFDGGIISVKGTNFK